MLLAIVLAAILQTPTGLPEADTSDAYLDAGAAAMVSGARARNSSVNERIEAYQAFSKQRLSAGIRGLRRDRMLYSRELGTRIDWRRGGDMQVEVLGSRQASEVAGQGVEPFLGNDMLSAAAGTAFDPSTEWLLRIPSDGVTDDSDGDSTALMHPLRPGSEAHYRFRSGETTSIRLGDGRVIRIRELQVLPRRSQSNLVTGSLWLEAGTHAAVRGVFTLAAPVVFSLDLGPRSILLGTFDSLVSVGSASLGYLTIEYGLWDDEWWLPRLIALEGTLEVGRFAMPLVFEQLFSDYRVFADPAAVPPLEPVDTLRFESAIRGCQDDNPEVDGAEKEEECSRRIVLVPRDTSSLMASEIFPRPIFGDTRLMTDDQLEQMVQLVGASRLRSILFRTPRFDWRPLDGSLMHYNRVEGLSIGTSALAELQPFSLTGAVWIGLADREPGVQVNLGRSRYAGSETLGFYRRVEAFTPEDRPFSLGSSISAFALGNDDGDYFRSVGAAITSEQVPSGGTTLRARIYVERQSALEKNTDGSLPGWLGNHTFRENPAASDADQVGIDVRARTDRGSTSRAFRGGVEGRLRAERGTFSFAQPSATAYSLFPVPGGMMVGLDAGIGLSFGDVPVQSLWYLGGPSTVRGFRPEDRAAGEAYWRARAEIGNDFPGARVVLFSDAGWAGGRSDFAAEPSLISAGVGASFLDGLIRADLARTLRGGRGRWGVEIYLDAIF